MMSLDLSIRAQAINILWLPVRITNSAETCSQDGPPVGNFTRSRAVPAATPSPPQLIEMSANAMIESYFLPKTHGDACGKSWKCVITSKQPFKSQTNTADGTQGIFYFSFSPQPAAGSRSNRPRKSYWNEPLREREAWARKREANDPSGKKTAANRNVCRLSPPPMDQGTRPHRRHLLTLKYLYLEWLNAPAIHVPFRGFSPRQTWGPGLGLLSPVDPLKP